MYNKNNNWKCNLVAIALTVAAAAAPVFAQGITLRASVPFAFSINREALAPGTYVVTYDKSVWTVRNESTRKAVAIVNYSGRQGQRTEDPALTFNCFAEHCQLRAIHLGGRTLGAEVPAPQPFGADRSELRLVSVALNPVQ
jgi:hypothetical protein